MLVAYARVSSTDQDLTVQRERLAHCEKKFEEKASGASEKRPALQECLNFVREGDTLVITRLDRLACSTLHLCQIADMLAKKGVHLSILDQAVDTHTPTGRLLFGMLSVIAQFELELRAERQREGIAKAQKAGVHFGRTKRLTPGQVDTVRLQRARGATLAALQTQDGIGKTALYRSLKQGGPCDEYAQAEAAD